MLDVEASIDGSLQSLRGLVYQSGEVAAKYRTPVSYPGTNCCAGCVCFDVTLAAGDALVIPNILRSYLALAMVIRLVQKLQGTIASPSPSLFFQAFVAMPAPLHYPSRKPSDSFYVAALLSDGTGDFCSLSLSLQVIRMATRRRLYLSTPVGLVSRSP